MQLALDCKFHHIEPLKIQVKLDLKKAFAKVQRVKPRVGMKRAMSLVGLPIEGRAHRALDDTKSISKLLPFIFGLEKIKR